MVKAMLFKSDRIKDEYTKLALNNAKLYGILEVACAAFNAAYGKDFMLTSILRTKAENDELYKATPPDKRPQSSPHLFWQAADIRTKDLSKDEIEFLLKEFNSNTVYQGRRKCALYHEIPAQALHLHIQSDVGV